MCTKPDELKNPPSRVWKAKNLPDNDFDLEVPIYDTCAEYLPYSTNEFVTTTAHGEIRLYDTRAQARPVMDHTPNK